ncbi:hypothetical protein PENTCL1PPCAC_15309, partial [Pristionchus entomophagus]
VIYYMTDSNPSTNLGALNAFKSSGVIIVNNFGVARPQLKGLASDGFYYADTNYMLALQGFCKANCFCKVGQDVYGGTDAAIVASGGCYHATGTGVSFNKAKTTCATDGGFIASVHDDA